MLGGWAKHMPVSIVHLIAMRNGIRAALETADAIAWHSAFTIMATHIATTHGQHAADKFVTRNPHLRAQCDLLRDIFNPFFRDPVNSNWLTWNNATIPKLAQTIYDDRRYDIMPILGDALEDAGCTDSQILDHCRGAGPHVRGCWVVDLILGKE